MDKRHQLRKLSNGLNSIKNALHDISDVKDFLETQHTEGDPKIEKLVVILDDLQWDILFLKKCLIDNLWEFSNNPWQPRNKANE